MKKYILTLIAMIVLLCSASCLAMKKAESSKTADNKGMNWEISMIPKETAEEKEANRWSIILENNTGIYAYDMASLSFTEEKNGVADKNMISCIVKTVFNNKDMLKSLNSKYKLKLAKGEKVEHCILYMTFNLVEKSYVVRHMEVFGNKKTLLETQDKELKLVPVPEGSFAEAMYEICKKAVENQAKEGKAE